MNWRVVAIYAVGIGVVSGTRALDAQQRSPMRVENAAIDKEGRVHLRWTGQPEQVVARDRDGYCEDAPHCEDAGADQLQISENRLSVGWTAEYNGCCQSYPLPWVLVIARNGRVVRRIGAERPVFDWLFEQGDRLVALFSDTPHGDLAPVCELVDTRTGKRLATWDVQRGVKPPTWAEPLAKNFIDAD